MAGEARKRYPDKLQNDSNSKEQERKQKDWEKSKEIPAQTTTAIPRISRMQGPEIRWYISAPTAAAIPTTVQLSHAY